MGEILGFALRLTEENKAEVNEKEEERMRNNKVGAIFVMSALALSGVAMSYAMWSETLIINGSVHTGVLDLEWSVESVGDNEIEGKQFSEITATIDDNTGIMTVYVEDAYPCITYWVNFNVENVGTIAAHFNDFVVVPESWVTAGIITIGPQEPYAPIETVQLHPSEEWLGTLTFHFDNDDGFAEITDYTFTVTLFGYQYNEQCGQTTGPKPLSLPEGTINFKAWFTGYPADLYSCVARLFNLPAGSYNVVNNGVYTLWCFEEGPIIYVGTYEGNAPTYSAVLYSSYDPMLPAEFQDPDWDMVNWILNHKGDYAGATGQDIQEAIWYFKDGGATPTNPIGQQIVADALIYGEGFIPGSGQWCAVIIDVIDPAVQDVFIEVDP